MVRRPRNLSFFMKGLGTSHFLALGVTLAGLWGHFLWDLGSFWLGLSVILAWLWDHFGWGFAVILAGLWGHFGKVLESFWLGF